LVESGPVVIARRGFLQLLAAAPIAALAPWRSSTATLTLAEWAQRRGKYASIVAMLTQTNDVLNDFSWVSVNPSYAEIFATPEEFGIEWDAAGHPLGFVRRYRSIFPKGSRAGLAN
jgi:hypothetical protein